MSLVDVWGSFTTTIMFVTVMLLGIFLDSVALGLFGLLGMMIMAGVTIGFATMHGNDVNVLEGDQ